MYEVFVMLLSECHLDAASVCRYIGVSQSTISNWKTRNNLISADIGLKIAEFFNISLDYLYTGTKPIPPELSDIEKQLLEGFQAANDTRKNDMLAMAHRAIMEKRERLEMSTSSAQEA